MKFITRLLFILTIKKEQLINQLGIKRFKMKNRSYCYGFNKVVMRLIFVFATQRSLQQNFQTADVHHAELN